MGRASSASIDPREEIARGIDYLCKRDPVMAELIRRTRPFEIHPESDIPKALARAIVSQQISTGAARSIFGRLLALALEGESIPEVLMRVTAEDLRAAGLSSQKVRYLRDLAEHAVSGRVRLHDLHAMGNDEIITELTRIKGVGRWTAQMLLIFSLGRLNVFPADDLGVRTAIQRLYRKRSLPTPRQLGRMEKLWQPYASIASWYCWRSLEKPV